MLQIAHRPIQIHLKGFLLINSTTLFQVLRTIWIRRQWWSKLKLKFGSHMNIFRNSAIQFHRNVLPNFFTIWWSAGRLVSSPEWEQLLTLYFGTFFVVLSLLCFLLIFRIKNHTCIHICVLVFFIENLDFSIISLHKVEQAIIFAYRYR